LFRRSGPLSSFSAKIDLARLLGMTSDVIHSDLHILRNIRNEFAHSIMGRDSFALTFQSPRIREKCMEIRCVRHEGLVEPRHVFMRACAVLNADFYVQKLNGKSLGDLGRIVSRDE
jgi:hypothetical protein